MKTMMMAIVLLVIATCGFAQPSWIEHEISPASNSASDLSTVDLDGDGDTDLIGTSRSMNTVFWWERDGDAWLEHIVSASFSGANGVVAADFDSDGDMDLASCAFNSDEVAWFENDGNQNFFYHSILAAFDGPDCIALGDFNDDGAPDFVSSAYYGDSIKWFESDAGDWVVHSIHEGQADVNKVDVADFDGDGDQDVVSSSGDSTDEIKWWENDADGWVMHTIGTSGNSPWGVSAGDVDLDGDPDVVMGYLADDMVVWWENQGEGTSWTEHVVAVGYNGANRAVTADVDGDGNMDIVAVARNLEVVTLWLGTGTDWEEHVVGTNVDNGWVVNVGDADDDYDIDVLAAGLGVNAGRGFLVYEQEGEGDPPGPVTFELLPQNAPVVIPPSGGTVVYDVSLESQLPNMVPGLSYWTTVTLPNGQEIGPITTVPFTHTPFMDVFIVGITQAVPLLAPAGSYTFTGSIGFAPNALLDDEFTFTKLGATPDRWVGEDEMTMVKVSAPSVNRTAFGQWQVGGTLSAGELKGRMVEMNRRQ